MSQWQSDAAHLTRLAPDLSMEQRRALWERYHVRVAQTQCGYLEGHYLLPTEARSCAGGRNQALNARQILGIILSLCTRGFTCHSHKARTLWFAIKVAEDLGLEYQIHVRLDRAGISEYALVRRHWQPGIAESDTYWRWWTTQPQLARDP